TQLLHGRDVLAEAVVVVVGDVAGVPVLHLAGGVAVGVPDGGGTAARVGGALDLVGRGRRAPDEALGQVEAERVGRGGGLDAHGVNQGADALLPSSWVRGGVSP